MAGKADGERNGDDDDDRPLDDGEVYGRLLDELAELRARAVSRRTRKTLGHLLIDVEDLRDRERGS